jgi:predicted amidohydrolase
MDRKLRVGAAQMGPILKDESREHLIERHIKLLEEASRRKIDIITFPECSLSFWFPSIWLDDTLLNQYFEKEMPNPSVQPLFDRASDLGVAFVLGYAELDGKKRFNTSALVNKDGKIIGKYRKAHLPGTKEPVPGLRCQSYEKRYFLEGDTGFKVWRMLDTIIGMCICNDRRWPEVWRVMGLQGVELVFVGWNSRNRHLANFHNQLSLQAGAYQNGVWVVGAAKCGQWGGCDYIGDSMIVSPLGEVVAKSHSLKDELIDATIDLDLGKQIKNGIFNFELHRRPDLYGMITERKGAILP